MKQQGDEKVFDLSRIKRIDDAQLKVWEVKRNGICKSNQIGNKIDICLQDCQFVTRKASDKNHSFSITTSENHKNVATRKIKLGHQYVVLEDIKGQEKPKSKKSRKKQHGMIKNKQEKTNQESFFNYTKRRWKFVLLMLTGHFLLWIVIGGVPLSFRFIKSVFSFKKAPQEWPFFETNEKT